MKKFAVVLSGSGVYDGSEIHEAVLTLLAIDNAGAEYSIFAPNNNQYHVINHLNGEESRETRNVLVESARIARGNISDLSEYNSDKFDALIFPGGFGVAKNLSDYAFKGSEMQIDPLIEKIITEMHNAHKPIGALCIAPILLAKIINSPHITIGSDPGTVTNITQMGGKHIETKEEEVTIDENNLLFTTPCYMLDAKISQIATSADNLVKAMVKYIN